ncbi:MAG: transcription termination/antitermination protein NusG [Thermoanaerobaculia bacterium]
MPLLKREPEISSEGLFELPEAELPWWVAHVKSRQEKAFARQLRSASVPYYLPQREKRVRRSGRTFVSYLPLFPGYVFFRADHERRRAALRSNVLVRFLHVPDQSLLTQELAQLRALQESGVPLVPHPPLHPGDAVRISDGPFKGYTGVAMRERGRLRLVVAISMLGKAASVEFDKESLCPVSPRPSPSGHATRAVA